MNLDATRRRRAAVRENILARSLSVARASGQGVGLSDSSVVGAQAQVQTSGANRLLSIRQGRTSGNRLFDINQNITQTHLDAQDRNLGFLEQQRDVEAEVRSAQQHVVSLGGQISGLSGGVASAQGSGALGTGLMNLGGMFLGNANTIGSIGQSLPGLFQAGGFGSTSGTAIY